RRSANGRARRSPGSWAPAWCSGLLVLAPCSPTSSTSDRRPVGVLASLAMTPTPEQLTWLGMLTVLVGFLVRLLKADTLNGLLAPYSIPPIPKAALPWVALLLGFAGGSLEALTRGATWSAAALSGLMGVISGTIAIAGNETLPPVARAIHAPTAHF